MCIKVIYGIKKKCNKFKYNQSESTQLSGDRWNKVLLDADWLLQYDICKMSFIFGLCQTTAAACSSATCCQITTKTEYVVLCDNPNIP